MNLRFQFGSDPLEGGAGVNIDNLSIVGVPLHPGSFVILSITRSDEGVTMVWSSEPDKSYAVEYSETLSVWAKIQDLPSAGHTTSFTDSEPARTDRVGGWYRIRETP